MPLPNFPDLPGNWPGAIFAVYEHLRGKYEHARTVLAQEQLDDPGHLRILFDDLNTQDEALEALQTAGVNHNWVVACSEHLSALLLALRTAAEASEAGL